MRKLILRKVALGLTALVGVSVLAACSYTNPVARSYYLDHSCSVYYVDDLGNKVYSGKYDREEMLGLTMMKGDDGRWYYQDAWGNRVYKSKYCK